GQPVPEDSVSLLAPIANPGKLIAVAGGYYEHERAEPLRPDALPLLFAKRTDDIKGPGHPITIWPIPPGVIDAIEVAIVLRKSGASAESPARYALTDRRRTSTSRGTS